MDRPEPIRRPWLTQERAVLLVVALAVALGLGWLAWQVQIVRHRRAMREQIEAHNGRVIESYWAPGGALETIVQIRTGDPDRKISEIRRLLGDPAVGWIVLGPGVAGSDGEETKAFPEADVFYQPDVF